MGGGGVCWPEVVEKEVQAVGAVVICGRRPEDGKFGRSGGWTQARFCIFETLTGGRRKKLESKRGIQRPTQLWKG
jgi:hypothetical protein